MTRDDDDPRRPSTRGTILFPLLVVLAIRLWVALAAPLIPQEAYHWEYAVHPALSYFDHPPLTGWSIAAGTALLGSGRLGIRLASLLLALGTTLIGIRLVRDFGGGAHAQRLWCLATLVVPMLGFGMTLAMTEGPLLCGWMLAMWGLWRARDGGTRWWLITGLGVGAALLSKYTALFLVIAVLMLTAFAPRLRRQLRSRAPWIGLLLAGTVFSPVIYWNEQHAWVSFTYQSTIRYLSSSVSAKAMADSLGGQLLALTPVIALAVGFATVWWLRRWRSDPRSAWILAFGVPLPLFMAVQAPWVTVKLNWVAPAYLILIVGLVLWAENRRVLARSPGCRIATRVTVAASVALLVLSPAAGLIPEAWGNYWSGWDVVAAHAEGWEERLEDGDADEGSAFFFTVGANEAAALDYWLHRLHAELSPLEPVLPESVLGGSGLAFDTWVPASTMAGKNAIAVVTHERAAEDGTLPAELRSRFDAVERVEEVRVRSFGVEVQRSTVWACRGYRAP